MSRAKFKLQPGDIVFRARREDGREVVRMPHEDEWYFVEIVQPNFTRHIPQARVEWATKSEFPIYDCIEIPESAPKKRRPHPTNQ